MRNSVYAALLAALVWAALSLLSLGTGRTGTPGSLKRSSPPPVSQETSTPETPQVSQDFDSSFRLPVLRDGVVERMDLRRYLTGVLLAEMPSSFQEEALKAQAVSSRTYALRSCQHRRHEDAALCTNPGCCQGWVDPQGVDSAARARAEAAVLATDGLAIYYEGQLIEATFFSCSGGQTETAAAVWGNDLPYLQAVESPGEEGAAHYSDEIQISLEAFRAALEALSPGLSLEGDPSAWLGEIRLTPGGGVEQIWLGGQPFAGTALRSCFELPSTVFTLELDEDGAVFKTRGYGHRVGMSQYGAEAMARAGNDFLTILHWYYQGVEILRAG